MVFSMAKGLNVVESCFLNGSVRFLDRLDQCLGNHIHPDGIGMKKIPHSIGSGYQTVKLRGRHQIILDCR